MISCPMGQQKDFRKFSAADSTTGDFGPPEDEGDAAGEETPVAGSPSGCWGCKPHASPNLSGLEAESDSAATETRSSRLLTKMESHSSTKFRDRRENRLSEPSAPMGGMVC